MIVKKFFKKGYFMTDIKLVALDLDGTLFNSNGKITEKTRERIGLAHIQVEDNMVSSNYIAM